MTHAAVILAAGASRRLGRPKQTLPWGKDTLLNVMVGRARASKGRVMVVLGAHREEIEATMGVSVERTWCNHWEEGMGASIVAGVQAVLPWNPASITLLLCDQPGVSAHDLLILRQNLADFDACAAHYCGKRGAPAAFAPVLYPFLLALDPREGARSLLRSREHRIGQLSMPGAAWDVDTPDDVARWSASFQGGLS